MPLMITNQGFRSTFTNWQLQSKLNKLTFVKKSDESEKLDPGFYCRDDNRL